MMVSVVSSNPTGGNFILFRHLDANFVQKCQKCQICVIYENLKNDTSLVVLLFYDWTCVTPFHIKRRIQDSPRGCREMLINKTATPASPYTPPIDPPVPQAMSYKNEMGIFEISCPLEVENDSGLAEFFCRIFWWSFCHRNVHLES